jgi:hypothetical protein
MPLDYLASTKRTIFHVEIGKIAIVEQTTLEIRREKRFFTFEKFGSDNFAIDESHILEATTIPLDEAEIAIREGAGGEFCIP